MTPLFPISHTPSTTPYGIARSRDHEVKLPWPAPLQDEVEEKKGFSRDLTATHRIQVAPVRTATIDTTDRSSQRTLLASECRNFTRDAILSTNVTLQPPLVDLITTYIPLPDDAHEVTLCQNLVPSLKKNDPNAYAKLASLIKNGLSTALLGLLEIEIPNFYIQLAAAVPWEEWKLLDKIPFTTSRKLEDGELYAHLYHLKKIFTQRTDSWSIKKINELNTQMQSLDVATKELMVEVYKYSKSRRELGYPLTQLYQGISLFSFLDFDAKDKLWRKMVEVLYPRTDYQASWVSPPTSLTPFPDQILDISPNEPDFIIPDRSMQVALHQATSLFDRGLELALYQELLPKIRNNDDAAYKRLAYLLQEGHSAALLTLVDMEIPAFYNKLSKVLSWDKIPFTAIKPLEMERFQHFSVLRKLLEHNTDLHPTSKAELHEELETLLNPSPKRYKVTNSNIFLYADPIDLRATIELWYDMTKLLYPTGGVELVTRSDNEIIHGIELRKFIIIHAASFSICLDEIELKKINRIGTSKST